MAKAIFIAFWRGIGPHGSEAVGLRRSGNTLHAVALSIMPNITVCRSAGSLRAFAPAKGFADFICQSAQTIYRLDRAAGIPGTASTKLFTRASQYFERMGM